MTLHSPFPLLPDQGTAARPSPFDLLLLQQLLDAWPEAQSTLRLAFRTAQRCHQPLLTELRASGFPGEAALMEQLSLLSGIPRLAEEGVQADPGLVARLGPDPCIACLCLPLGERCGRLVLAISDPAVLPQILAWPALRGQPPPEVLLAPPERIRTALAEAAREALLDRAENLLPPELSVRGRPRAWQGLLRRAVLLTALATLLLFPAAVLGLLTGWLCLAMIASGLLRWRALTLALRSRQRPLPPPRLPAKVPVISVMVPLFHEPDIAPRLVRRLEELRYPRACLEVLLILEASDRETLAALRAAGLPGWMQIIVVPEGGVTTKPRAMNYTLPFARGSLIGIFDAEDAPDPDTLIQVADRFVNAAPDLACLQGVLDYYNPRSNLIARLFTAEYAAWFRVMMPELQRAGYPMPLGGTTLFIRRDHLESIGAWDAHNVTEDADLGIRLARLGLRTEMLPVTTHEEANCRPRAWIRQRSRWIKGHLLTWAVHMRHPLRLWRELGPGSFLGYQIIFLGAQSQVLLAPLNWTFWLIFLGLPHPARGLVSEPLLLGLTGIFLTSEALLVGCALLGLNRTRHRGLWKVAALFQPYHLLAAIAGWRALIEAFHNPFYWAKTSHGHFDGDPAPAEAPQEVPDQTAAPGRRKRALPGPATVFGTLPVPVTARAGAGADRHRQPSRRRTLF